MSAQPKPERQLDLLMEPERPRRDTRWVPGWQRSKRYDPESGEWGALVRKREDDAFGAIAQRCVVAYIVRGVGRAQLARQTGLSERSMSDLLAGVTWVTYTKPVLAALRELGISEGRGLRQQWATRLHEIIEAQRRLLVMHYAAHHGIDTGVDAASLMAVTRLFLEDFTDER